MYGKLILSKVESSEDGFESATSDAELIGVEGNTLSDLRPAGKALINGRRIDVVTQGEYIDRDTGIVVIEVRGSRVVVRGK